MSTTCPYHRPFPCLPLIIHERILYREGFLTSRIAAKRLDWLTPVAAGVESALNSHHHAASILE
jgi:hypothetical protein